jgi:hypothetical protein
MKYALLVYDAPDAWKSLATEQEHAAHGEYHAVGASQGVIAHYRLRSSRRTTNVRLREGRSFRARGHSPTRGRPSAPST